MCPECGDGVVRADASGRFVLAQSDQFDFVDDSGNLVVLREWLKLGGGPFAPGRRQFSSIANIRHDDIQGVFDDSLVSKAGSHGEETPYQPTARHGQVLRH